MTPEELVARARAALGVEAARVRGELVLEAEGTFNGVKMRAEHRASASGRCVERITCPIGQVLGFDGVNGWSIDLTGLRGPLELEDLAILRVHSLVHTGQWVLPESGIVATEATTFAGRDMLTVRMGSKNGYSFRLHLDQDTHLPAKLEQPSEHENWVAYSDYRPGPWGRLAHRTTTRAGWLEDASSIVSVAHREDEDEAAYAPPTSTPTKATFDPRTSAIIPLGATRRGRLPLVRAKVEGRDVGWFLVDTGAASLGLDQRIADELAMPAIGRTWVTTTDGGTGTSYRFGEALEVGPLTIHAPRLLELDLAPLEALLGVRLAGVLGYDLFARALVRFRPEQRAMELHPSEGVDAADAIGAGATKPRATKLHATKPHATEPRATKPSATEAPPWQPLRFENKVPMIECVTEHGRGLFALDTGGALDVMLYPWTLSQWTLPPSRGRVARAHGLTGSGTVNMRTLPWMELGGARFERVRCAVSERRGVAGGVGKWGLVGWTAIRRRELVLDYAAKRFAFTARRER